MDYPFATHNDANFNLAVSTDEPKQEKHQPLITVNDFMALYGVLGCSDAYSIGVYPRSLNQFLQERYGLSAYPLIDGNAKIEVGYICPRDQGLSAAGMVYLESLRKALVQYG